MMGISTSIKMASNGGGGGGAEGGEVTVAVAAGTMVSPSWDHRDSTSSTARRPSLAVATSRVTDEMAMSCRCSTR